MMEGARRLIGARLSMARGTLICSAYAGAVRMGGVNGVNALGGAAKLLLTTSNGISHSEHEISQPRPSHLGKLSRLLLKFWPLWPRDYRLEKPRRSIDRELQEREPMDLM
jgi:hypothetical protein